MKNGFVADASVGIAWVIAAQATEATERLLDDAMSGVTCIVPSVWPLEVANTLLTLLRRQRIDREAYTLARAELQTLNPIVDEEGSPLALTAIADLAEEHRLTVYDAAYLELALRRQLALASRDSALNQAAAKCGIEISL